MKKIVLLLFLLVFVVACEKGDGSSSDCDKSAQAEDSSTNCTISTNPPINGGGTTGGTTGGTDGGTTGGTTGGTDGGTSGGTTGGTTGGTGSSGLPNEAYTFGSNIVFVNADATQLAKFQKAVEIIKDVVATEEFRTKVLNHTYNGSKTYVDNGGNTNAQIYQKILEGKEGLFPTKNNAMDMEVELYYAATSTVGYTYANSKRIWVNTKYFNTYTAASVAANLFHEWLHKAGFTHASSYSTSRDYSVPYAIGRMVGSIGKQFL